MIPTRGIRPPAAPSHAAPSHTARPKSSVEGLGSRVSRAPYHTKIRKYKDAEKNHFLEANHVHPSRRVELAEVFKERKITTDAFRGLPIEAKLAAIKNKNHIPEVPKHPRAQELLEKHREMNQAWLEDEAKETRIQRQARAAQFSELTPEGLETVIHRKFDKMAGPGKESYSDVYNSAKSVKEVYGDNIVKRKRQNAFLENVDKLTQSKKHADYPKVIKGLEDFIYDQDGGIRRFNAHELHVLLRALWNHEGYSQIVELMLEVQNEELLNDSATLILMAQSALKSHDYFNPFIAIEIGNLLLHRGTDDENAYMLLGLAHALRNDAAANYLNAAINDNVTDADVADYLMAFPEESSLDYSSIEKNFKDTLSLSRLYYNKAFQEGFDPKLGLRVMLKDLQAVNREHAKQTAEIIQMGCFRDGIPFSNNFAVVRAFLNASYVSGKYQEFVPKAEAQLLTLCKTQKETQNAIIDLKELNEVAHSEQIEGMIRRLEKHKAELHEADNYADVLKLRKREADAIKLPTTPETIGWSEKSYGYAGLTSNYVTGTLIATGGQVPSHMVNKYDQQFFNQIVKTPLGDLIPDLKETDPELAKLSLDNTDDPHKALDLIDRFLRTQYKTDEWELENLESEGHKKLDQATVAAIKLTGVDPAKQKAYMKAEGAEKEKKGKEVVNDNTNLSMHLFTRLGDCRHHAQCKQMLFETWRREKINRSILHAQMGLEFEDKKAYEEAVGKFNSLMRVELRVWDMEVGVRPKGNPEGWEKIESHVTNVLLTYDEKRRLSDVHISDGFYQTVYPFKLFPLNYKGKDPSKDLYPVGVKYEHKGEKKDLIVKTSSRAGPREQYVKGDTHNHFIGLREKKVSVEEMLQKRDEIAARNDEILAWSQGKSIPSRQNWMKDKV